MLKFSQIISKLLIKLDKLQMQFLHKLINHNQTWLVSLNVLPGCVFLKVLKLSFLSKVCRFKIII